MVSQKMKPLVEKYLEHRLEDASGQTMANLTSSLSRLADEWDRTRRVATSIDEEWMRDFLYSFRRGGVGGKGKNLAVASYNKVVSDFRGFLHYLVRRRLVDPFVLDACRPLTVNEEKDYLRLSAAQVVHMIETCEDPWERWVLAFASQTLGRDSELRNRRVKNLHLDRGVIDWRRQKTKDSDDLFITQDLADEWDRWVRIYQGRCGSIQEGWFVIPRRYNCFSARGDWTYLPDAPPKRVGHVVQQHAARVTGVTVDDLKGQGAHIIRRSMARALYDRLVALGVPDPIRKVMAALGHKNQTTTELYLGIRADREARNSLLIGSNLLWADRDNVVTLRGATNASSGNA